jgi:hypothetical protein
MTRRAYGAGAGVLGGMAMAVVWAALGSGPVRAEGSTFRCPTDRLIRVDEPLIEARAKCGTPTHVVQRNEKEKVSLRARHAAGSEFIEEREITLEVEEWYFDLGRNRFSRLIRFENGRLAKITTGQYGAGSSGAGGGSGAASASKPDAAAPDAGAKN